MDILKIRKKAKEFQSKKKFEQEQFLSSEETPQPQKEIKEKEIVEQTLSSVEQTKDSVVKEVIPHVGEKISEVSSEETLPEEQILESTGTEEEQEEERPFVDVPHIEVLEFILGVEEYGVNLQDVKEIIRMKPITEVPRSPSFVKGIISLRGTIIPVIDLKQRLKLDNTVLTPATRIIITTDEARYVGVIVDRINGVVKIREDGIEPTPPTISPDVAEFIKGLGKYSDKIVRLLDVHKVLQF